MTLAEKILNLFVTKNYLSQENLEAIKVEIESANNLKELLDVFKFIESLNLRFKNENLAKNYILVFGLAFIVLWLIGVIFKSKMFYFDLVRYYFCFCFGIIFFGIAYGWHAVRQVLNTTQISDSISLKKVTLDNKLSLDVSDKEKLFQSLENKFLIFQQGNYSREITRYIKGKYQNQFYHYFHFHYVDEYSSTSTDANGNKTSNTRYDDYDLYGIIIPFNGKNFIKISNCEIVPNFMEWQTSSIAFNQKFNIYTDNEQSIAMFLQPKVIEQIEKLYETFPKIDIELSPQGLLALSTPDENLLNYTRQYGVDQLDLFKDEIKKVLDQTKLFKALEFLSFLEEYHIQT